MELESNYENSETVAKASELSWKLILLLLNCICINSVPSLK